MPLSASSDAHSPKEPLVTGVSACNMVLQNECVGQFPADGGMQLSGDIVARNAVQRSFKSNC